MLSDWSSHIFSWIDDHGLPLLVLQYKDMLEDTNTSFRKALDFQKNQRALEATKIDVLKKMEENEGFIEKPIGMKAFF